MTALLSRMYLRQEMDRCQVEEVATGDVAAFSRGRPDADRSNQDGAALVGTDRWVVLAVADGLGGGPSGAQAAAIALSELANAVIDGNATGRVLRDSILDGFESANREVRALGGGAGTTLAVAEVSDRQLRSYHVGDSAVLQSGQRGKLKLLTTAHSPTGFAVESGLLGEEQALRRQDRHVVSNVVGDRDMKIEMSSRRRLGARDRVLLASDGLFDNLTSSEIVDAVRTGSPDAAAAQLVRLCDERMRSGSPRRPSKPDDLTLLVFRPRWDA